MSATQWYCTPECWDAGEHTDGCHPVGQLGTRMVRMDDGHLSIAVVAKPDAEWIESPSGILSPAPDQPVDATIPDHCVSRSEDGCWGCRDCYDRRGPWSAPEEPDQHKEQ